MPFAPTTAVPTVVPVSGSRTVTVAPGSPVPVTEVPSGVTLAVGAAGGERSGAVTMVGGEWLPAGSVCTTVTGSPSNTAGGSDIE